MQVSRAEMNTEHRLKLARAQHLLTRHGVSFAHMRQPSSKEFTTELGTLSRLQYLHIEAFPDSLPKLKQLL